ncbi:hypothetical protein Ciccas_009904 [Cichlidogyrus casuarinus]|uniref:Uncharacterized protein n=1 Tax=Cichlidogyrus casuarinus TaxID=1844966 RepID=A0ABD2PXJ3_9PLAT
MVDKLQKMLDHARVLDGTDNPTTDGQNKAIPNPETHRSSSKAKSVKPEGARQPSKVKSGNVESHRNSSKAKSSNAESNHSSPKAKLDNGADPRKSARSEASLKRNSEASKSSSSAKSSENKQPIKPKQQVITTMAENPNAAKKIPKEAKNRKRPSQSVKDKSKPIPTPAKPPAPPKKPQKRASSTHANGRQPGPQAPPTGGLIFPSYYRVSGTPAYTAFDQYGQTWYTDGWGNVYWDDKRNICPVYYWKDAVPYIDLPENIRPPLGYEFAAY